MSIDTSSKQRAQDADVVEAPRTSGQAIWPIVMMREIVVKLRDRNFVVGTLVTLLLLAGGLAFQAFMSGKSNEVTVAVSGDGARQVMQQVGDSAPQRGDDMVLTISDAADPAAVDAAVRDGKADVGLVHGTDGWQLVGKTDVKSSMTSAVTESVRRRGPSPRTPRAPAPRWRSSRRAAR